MAFQTPQTARAQQVASKLKQGMITVAEASYLLANPQFNVMSPSALSALRSQVAAGSLGRPGGGLTRVTEPGYARKPDHAFMFIFGAYPGFTQPVDFGTMADRTVLPVAPESFEYSIKNNATVFTSMSGKAFSHAGAEDLLRISFDTFIPAGLTTTDPENFPEYVYRDAAPASTSDMFEPAEFVSMMQSVQAANQPFFFSVMQSQSTPTGIEIISPIAMTVVDFTPSYRAGQGLDVAFSISLQKWNPQAQALTTGTRIYVTKPGDKYNCGNIAVRELGDMSRFKEIKALNRVILDADHTKRIRQKAAGMSVRTDFITPGLRLTLPLRAVKKRV